MSDWLKAMHEASAKSPGASAKTARQDKFLPGPEASAFMAAKDWKSIRPHLIAIQAEAKAHDLPVGLVCAIISRESRGGKALDRQGLGDHGNAFGVMQVDKRYHRISGGRDPWSERHLAQACGILARYIDEVCVKHPAWPAWAQIKGACVAYNSGVRNVQTIEGMDRGTTGDDYGSDVVCRAAWYELEIMELFSGH